MGVPVLERRERDGVALLGSWSCPGGVTLAFTERAGGVSAAPYASLNLGAHCGDSPESVAENRRRALAAAGAGRLAPRLVEPRQVHGDHVVVVRDLETLEQVRAEARAGADAVVCTVAGVPVLLCFADCVPVVLVGPGGFAVVHSGWRGTIARISAKAARVLCDELGCEACELAAYVGPHIAGADYEVSAELLERFVCEFGERVRVAGGPRNLSLSAAVAAALEQAGLSPEAIVDECPSTASTTSRFFSYRAEGGVTGRHGALAFIEPSITSEVIVR